MSALTTFVSNVSSVFTEGLSHFKFNRKVFNPLKSICELYQDIRSEPQSIRAVRFAVGMTLSIAFSSATDWPLAFLVPVLVVLFLATPKSSLSLVEGIACILFAVAACSIGLAITLLLQYPMIFFLILMLVLFNLYYLHNRGGPVFFVLMTLIAILILPTLGATNDVITSGAAAGIALSGWISIVFVWIAYYLVPDSSEISAKVPEKQETTKDINSLAAAQAALKSAVVVAPMAMIFISYELSSLLIVLIYTGIYSLAPDVSKGRSSGANSLRSTIIGGAYAFIVFFLLVAVPEYHFFIAIMFLVTLIMGSNIFSSNPFGKYYGSAFTAMYVLISNNLNSDTGFLAEFISRFVLILLAALYVIYSLKVFEAFWPQRKIN